MTLPKTFSDYLAARAADRLSYAEHYIDTHHPTESPIERLFLLAFYLVGNDSGGVVFDEPPPGYDDAWFFVKKQEPILSYRADFVIGLVEYPRTTRVVVECDGHDYHERTKEQAAHDRRRDREMQADGYKVFRFTGSELHRDAIKCAEEVVRELERIHYQTAEGQR
jgi:very-short-patch-repair endonuclease